MIQQREVGANMGLRELEFPFFFTFFLFFLWSVTCMKEISFSHWLQNWDIFNKNPNPAYGVTKKPEYFEDQMPKKIAAKVQSVYYT
jgi:hypothetical protein